jgi:hypothetical protein
VFTHERHSPTQASAAQKKLTRGSGTTMQRIISTLGLGLSARRRACLTWEEAPLKRPVDARTGVKEVAQLDVVELTTSASVTIATLAWLHEARISLHDSPSLESGELRRALQTEPAKEANQVHALIHAIHLTLVPPRPRGPPAP